MESLASTTDPSDPGRSGHVDRQDLPANRNRSTPPRRSLRRLFLRRADRDQVPPSAKEERVAVRYGGSRHGDLSEALLRKLALLLLRRDHVHLAAFAGDVDAPVARDRRGREAIASAAEAKLPVLLARLRIEAGEDAVVATREEEPLIREGRLHVVPAARDAPGDRSRLAVIARRFELAFE